MINLLMFLLFIIATLVVGIVKVIILILTAGNNTK